MAIEVLFMATCPHCGQEIEFVQAPQVPWWKLDLTSHGVSLGCGSLILIAIIVATCSGGGGLSGRIQRLDPDVQKRIERLDLDIQKLEIKINDVGEAIDKLSKKL